MFFVAQKLHEEAAILIASNLSVATLLSYWDFRLLAYTVSLSHKTYHYYYVAAKATYIRLLYGQKWGFSALDP